jgi:hypothetical protein
MILRSGVHSFSFRLLSSRIFIVIINHPMPKHEPGRVSQIMMKCMCCRQCNQTIAPVLLHLPQYHAELNSSSNVVNRDELSNGAENPVVSLLSGEKFGPRENPGAGSLSGPV